MTSGRQHRIALPAGYRLHWYEISSVLGQGGFGITYLARDTNLDQPVAVKEYLPTELAVRTHDSSVQPLSDSHMDTYGWGLQRFIAEAQTLARFRHPNIVLVHSVFEANQTAYMVMEYVEGRTLGDALKFKKIDGEETLRRMMLALLDGLELIHQAGFIHRDIKPENIYLRDDGTPVLLDFGSARQAVGGQTRTLTALVSPGYAPYEQYDSSRTGEAKQGPWTDIYALGATLYRAVSGKGPIDAMARINSTMAGEELFQKASVIGAGSYSPAFLKSIDWALELRPADRPQNIDVWRRSLSGELPPNSTTLVHGTPPADSAAPPSSVQTQPAAVSPAPVGSRSSVQKNFPWGLGVGGFAVVLLVFGGWWITTSTDLFRTEPAVSPTNRSDSHPTPRLRLAVSSDTSPAADQLAAAAEPLPAASPTSTEIRQPAAEKEETKTAALSPAATGAETRPRDMVANLLALAETDIQAGRLTAPPGENALERYAEALKHDPGNPVATEGKRRIRDHFLKEASALIAEENFSAAEKALIWADAVEPAGMAVRLARARLSESRLAAENRGREALRHGTVTETAREADQTIQALLTAADEDLKALRLTSPAGNNAFERYQSVLVLDRENGRAREGLLGIVKEYIRLKDLAVAENDIDKAREYLEKAEKVLPGSELIADERAALISARAGAAPAQKESTQATLGRNDDSAQARAEGDQPARAPAGANENQADLSGIQRPPGSAMATPPATPWSQSITNLSTAVLPVGYPDEPGGNRYRLENNWNGKVVFRHISNFEGTLKLTHAFGNGTLTDSVLSDAEKVWVAKTESRKEPSIELIYERASRLPVDVVVMAWLEPNTFATSWPAEYYLIDVPNRRVFHNKGMAGPDGYMGKVLSVLLEEFIAARNVTTAKSNK